MLLAVFIVVRLLRLIFILLLLIYLLYFLLDLFFNRVVIITPLRENNRLAHVLIIHRNRIRLILDLILLLLNEPQRVPPVNIHSAVLQHLKNFFFYLRILKWVRVVDQIGVVDQALLIRLEFILIRKRPRRDHVMDSLRVHPAVYQPADKIDRVSPVYRDVLRLFFPRQQINRRILLPVFGVELLV